ncbi:hypothetical protein C3007_09300 [Avibacterium gallinarum]|nr:hypothetical protein C3007_09300 [Avibacterium gallinarum]
MKYILFTILTILFVLIIIDINLNIKYSIFVDETMDHILYKRIFSFLFLQSSSVNSLSFEFFFKKKKIFYFLIFNHALSINWRMGFHKYH